MKRWVKRKPLLLASTLLTVAALSALVGCRGPRVEAGPMLTATNDPAMFLGHTTMVDSDHPSIVAVARRVAANQTTARGSAEALHDFVRDEIVFGFQPEFYDVRASEVLAAGKGYCNTKSTLFVALLRSQGIPARQRFVNLDSRVLYGVINTGTTYVDHSYTEVWLDGRWVRTDSYVVDLPTFHAASARLRTEGLTLGYGVHRSGTPAWDGTHDSFTQFVTSEDSSMSTTDYGIFADTAAFYRDVANADNRRSLFLKWLGPFAFSRANTILEALREGSRQ
jgi:hypothetical protein